MDKKFILILDAIVILGSLLTVFFVVGYTQPLAIGPLAGSEESLMFVFPSADYLMLDDNIKFESPTTIFIDDNLNLESGRYYIKIDSGLSSDVREIKVGVDVVLQIRRLSNGSVGVFNVGESALEVETYKIGNSINSSLIYVGISSGNGGNEWWSII